MFLMEFDSLNVVKHRQQVSLDGVGVTGLTQDLKQGRVRYEEKSWKEQSLLLKVSRSDKM